MNTVEKKHEKSILEQLREIRNKIGDETQNMTFVELEKYIESQLQKSLYPKSVWKLKVIFCNYVFVSYIFCCK